MQVYNIYDHRASAVYSTTFLIITHPPKTSFSNRLHREALKQSATDPKTGIIDVGILTTGVSSSERSRRQLLAKELLKLLQSKAKTGTPLKTQAVLEMMQTQSQVVSYYIQLVYQGEGKISGISSLTYGSYGI